MNFLSILITLINASLFASLFSGFFLDMPARNNLANKERVLSSLRDTVSLRQAEIDAIKAEQKDLEKEIPEIPGKIVETKDLIRIKNLELSLKKKQFDRASSTLAVWRKQNTEKEGELKSVLALAHATTSPVSLVLGTTTIATTTDE